MNIRGYSLVCLLAFLFFATAAHAYEVVLKNGKVVQGTLVSEDDQMIVIQDEDGLRINIKKTNVDAEKTRTANPPEKVAPPAEPSKPAPLASSKANRPQQRPASIKPAKQVTEEDLKKLREKYDLGEGTFREEAPDDSEMDTENQSEPKIDEFSQASENEWHGESKKHRDQLKQAEERYNTLSQQCEELKKIAIQTHILVDQEGNELPMTETREKVCELADTARVQLEEERRSLSEFMFEAREKAIPPGWLRDEEGKDPNE